MDAIHNNSLLHKYLKNKNEKKTKTIYSPNLMFSLCVSLSLCVQLGGTGTMEAD